MSDVNDGPNRTAAGHGTDYEPYTDEEIQIGIEAGRRYLQGRRAAGNGAGPPGAEAAADTGWTPLEDAVVVDASQQKPDALVPGFVWRERVSIVSSEPKAGKSTVLAQALLAALDGEPFRGFCAPLLGDGTVAVISEEPLGLFAARLRRYGLCRERHLGRVWVGSPRQGLGRILAACERQRPAVVLVDSLTAWVAQTKAESMSDAMAMRRVVETLRALADAGAGVCLVHHARKSDGMLRDSSDLAASVDMIVSFDPVTADGDVCARGRSDLRQLSYVGRWPVDTLRLGFNPGTVRYFSDRDPAGCGQS